METLERIAVELPLVFPVHPRTRKQLDDHGIKLRGLKLVEPLSYIDFLGLQSHAAMVITDSGGVQEETTYLGVPCLTLRENTERPVTITMGANILVGTDVEDLEREARAVLAGRTKAGAIPPMWDGRTSERIADLLTTPGRISMGTKEERAHAQTV